ncbi:hypothetical protein JB92DRAFT_183594 [Gautieria morchelliformis]|nr:hypothetical protein JB92DRAFT_183594 [Gautieria morchelliformis]
MPSDNDNTGYTVGSLPPSLATPSPEGTRSSLDICTQNTQRMSPTICRDGLSKRGHAQAMVRNCGWDVPYSCLWHSPCSQVAFFFAPCRWWRAIGWFGCWLSGTIVVSSFHGICMVIYVFSDLQQLRSFELARHSISGPRAIARARPKLKSFFTREGEEEQTDNGNPGKSTESGGGTGTDPAPSQPPARHAVELPIPLEARQNIGEEKGTKISPGKGPWCHGQQVARRTRPRARLLYI